MGMLRFAHSKNFTQESADTASQITAQLVLEF
jgi:hypothetical protein